VLLCEINNLLAKYPYKNPSIYGLYTELLSVHEELSLSPWWRELLKNLRYYAILMFYLLLLALHLAWYIKYRQQQTWSSCTCHILSSSCCGGRKQANQHNDAAEHHGLSVSIMSLDAASLTFSLALLINYEPSPISRLITH